VRNTNENLDRYDFSDAGKGTPEVIILDPAGRENTTPVKLRKEPNGVFVCDYTPVVQGVHSVNVFYANQPVPRSPFAVGIANGNGEERFSVSVLTVLYTDRKHYIFVQPVQSKRILYFQIMSAEKNVLILH